MNRGFQGTSVLGVTPTAFRSAARFTISPTTGVVERAELPLHQSQSSMSRKIAAEGLSEVALLLIGASDV